MWFQSGTFGFAACGVWQKTHDSSTAAARIELALATPVVIWGGRPFFERGWASVVSRHLNMFTLIALGVGAVISGHFSGWNFGIGAGGWGGLFIAAILIAIMYLGLIFSLAEMSPALPHTGGASSLPRTAN